MKHDHSSPIEMGEIKFMLKVPMFVARQIIRHRTCLSGNTMLHFEGKDGKVFPRKMAEIHDLFHCIKKQKSGSIRKILTTENVVPDKIYSVMDLANINNSRPEYFRAAVSKGLLKATKNLNVGPTEPQIQILGKDYIDYVNNRLIKKDNYRNVNADFNQRIKKMKLRFYNEETGQKEICHITDIWQSGVKKTYKVTLDNNKTISMTDNHLCLTDRGWLELKEFVNFDTQEFSAKMAIFEQKGSNPYFQEEISINEEDEIWKDIPSISDYQISNYGRVKSFKNNRITIKKITNLSSRSVVSLPDKFNPSKSICYSVHKLVMLAFNGPMPEGCNLIRHLNGNSLDNRLENLKYGTYKENSMDMFEHNNQATNRISFKHISKVEFDKEEMTYDLTVDNKFHNFVANGFIVHNCNVNEVSARYSVLPNEIYIPDLEHISPQSTDNKQGRGGIMEEQDKLKIQNEMIDYSKKSYEFYELLINEETNATKDLKEDLQLSDDYNGIAREIARTVLPVGTYTQLVWKQDLRNLLHLLRLRLDPHAQYEIRVMAQAMYDLVQPLFPATVQAYDDYVRNAIKVSSMERNILKDLLSVDDIKNRFETMIENSGGLDNFLELNRMSKREFNDFKKEWGLN